MPTDPKDMPTDSVTKQPSSSSSTSTPPAKPTPPPAKREPEAPPFEKGLVSQLISQFGNDKIKVSYIRPLRVKISVGAEDIVEAATFIRDNLGFDHAEAVSGTDYPKDNQIEVIYQLGSYTRDDLAGHIFSLTTRTNRDDARLPT
ncbi:MAG: NADH-quinone oxidoreductase subunit C, partial [Nitrososphaeraceae archaeon]